jgi:hypothetical protein
MKHFYLNSAARTSLALCLAAGALAACGQNGQATSAPTPAAALPLEMTATTPTAIAPAPTVRDLPYAPPVRVGRLSDPDDTYAYADQADAENDAFGDAPPDYAVDYDGTRPWVWYGDDHSERVCEPLPGGGYRYYYYQPGAQYPYLVRDPEYTYGYDSGVLVVVYDRYGHALPQDQYDSRADAAGRILARATALYLATQQQQHQAVVAANWEARQERIASDNAAWQRAQQQQSGWTAYHAAHVQQEQAQWGQERVRREAEAARFAQATNHPQVAQRDWQAAQQAQTQAPGGSSAPFGLHLGGPKPPAATPAAPGAPPQTGAAPGGRPGETHTPPAPPSTAPAGPPPGGHGPGSQGAGAPGQGGEHHDHRGGPQGAAGPGAPAGAVTAQPARPATPPAAKPEFHAPPASPQSQAAPPKQTRLEQAFHMPPAAQAPKAVTAAPPKAFERPVAPLPHPEAVHPQAPVAHAAQPVVRATPPVLHAAPPPPRPAAVVAPKPLGDKLRPDDKHPPQ